MGGSVYPGPDGAWDHLRLNRNLPFAIRVAPDPDKAAPLLNRRDFRVLLVTANPGGDNRYGLAPFDVAETVSGLRRAMGHTPCTVLANVEGADGPPTITALRKCLGQKAPSWLHIICHGKVVEGSSVLYLEDDRGNVDGITSGELIRALQQQRTDASMPQFAFLCACETAHADTGRVIGDLGRRLVREGGFSAVLAMTERISIATATRFGERFYHHLTFHGAVDLAINAAAAELAEAHDITVPFLFSRLDGASLCHESEFLDFARVQEAWQEWLIKRRPVQLLSVRESVESPLTYVWKKDFLESDPYQLRVGKLVAKVAATVAHDSPREWREAVRRLQQVGLDRQCEDVATEIGPVVEACQRIWKQSRTGSYETDRQGPEIGSLKNSLDELQQLVKARPFRCCFPVHGQFGSGKSYFVNSIIEASADAESCFAVLPIHPRPTRSLEDEVLSCVNQAAGGLRSWNTMEELDRDMAWHGVTVVVVIDDLHLWLDRGAGGDPGLAHADLEDVVRRASRFRWIRWLVTIQDTCFDKVAFRGSFWREYGLTADRRHKSTAMSDDLVGWVPLNDLTEERETGIRILESNLGREDSGRPGLDPLTILNDDSPIRRRHLALPLVAAILTGQWERHPSPVALSISRESLVTELMEVFYSRHRGTDLKADIAEGLRALAHLFFTSAGNPTLAQARQALRPLETRADAVRAKLAEFGILGVRSPGLLDTPATTYIEYRFDPIWHFVLARDLLAAVGSVPAEDDELVRALAAQLGHVIDADHREGVGEFALTLILAGLLGPGGHDPRAARVAAAFATGVNLPNAAAFRTACFENPDFQILFTRMSRKRLSKSPAPRLLFSVLLFVDAAWETPLTSGISLVAGRYEAIRAAGYSDYCEAVLRRRINCCNDVDELWGSCPQLAGCEALGELSDDAPREDDSYVSNPAFELARAVVNGLRIEFVKVAANALPRLLQYLKDQRKRADRDHELFPQERSPYFFRQCLLFHFCDWYLRENRLDAWDRLKEIGWYHRRAVEKWGEIIALEMEQEVNKAFGRWFRWNRNRQSESYRRLLQQLIDSKDVDSVVTAYFMMRHTVVSKVKTHYVDAEFLPLLSQFKQLSESPQWPEAAQRLKAAMRSYPVKTTTGPVT